jgi:hypothetical protein
MSRPSQPADDSLSSNEISYGRGGALTSCGDESRLDRLTLQQLPELAAGREKCATATAHHHGGVFGRLRIDHGRGIAIGAGQSFRHLNSPFFSHCNNSKGQSLFPAGFSEGRGPAPDSNVTARVLPHSVVHDVQRALRVVCYADHGVSSLRKRDFEFTYGSIFLKRRAIALRESIVLPRKVPFGADQACRGESLGKRTINRPRSQSSMSRPSMNR